MTGKMAAKVAGYRAEGYRRFQLKVGGEAATDIERIHAVAAKLQPGDRLVADANTGWIQHEAVRVAKAVADVDVYIEQPCLTYDECLAVRRQCPATPGPQRRSRGCRQACRLRPRAPP